jgi:uncharacterized protein YegP (UPF0339 family)
MREAVTITGNPDLTPSQDYHHLRRKGIQHIEKLSSDLWTDYNSHDPGMTLLELLCYAITDLGWRTRLDVKDLLADQSAPSPESGKQFFTAREILITAPVTLSDYRKLLIDIDGVRNAWIRPVQPEQPSIYLNRKRSRLQYEEEEGLERLKARGFYDVTLELESDPSAGDLNQFEFELPVPNDTETHQNRLTVSLPSWGHWFTRLPAERRVQSVEMVVTGPDGRFGFEGDLSLKDNKGKVYKSTFTVRSPGKDLDIDLVNALIDEQKISAAYLEKSGAALAIARRAWKSLHRNRNLCEDFYSLHGIDVEEIGVCADLDVSTNANIDSIHAELLHVVSGHISPDVTFYTLKELRDKGRPVEEIFNGPALDHGFIDDDELSKARLKEQIRVSDLINLIMDIEGVKSIRSITLASSYQGEILNEGAEWKLDITSGRAPRLRADKSKIVFYKEDIPFASNRNNVRKSLRSLQLASRVSKLSPYENNDFEVPEGQDRQVADFTSVRVDLPDLYGVNRSGLSDPQSPRRLAQAAQLSAFLTLFDQLLANYLAQLANIKHLFSFDRATRKTYFNQVLFSLPDHAGPADLMPGTGTVFTDEDPPGIWIVILHCIRFLERKGGFSADSLHDRQMLEQVREEFLEGVGISGHEAADYLNELDRMIESPETYVDRRNRFLDHLLARFGEQFTDYVLLVHSSGEPNAGSRLIEDKIRFLEEIPVLSAARGQSYDYTDSERLWESENVSGFKKRLCRLMGIRNFRRRSLLCKEADQFFQMYEDASGKWRFRFTDEGGAVLLRSAAFPDEESCKKAIVAVKQRGGDPENYRFLTSKNHRYYFNLVDENDQVLATGLLFRTVKERKKGLRFVTNKLGICNKEGFHLVEHILLHPEKDGDPLLPVCISDEGAGCPGFRDPYSFRVSIVVPYWPKRFRSMEFRRFFERMARLELPAHIHAKICWVNEEDMERFEGVWQKWLKAKSKPDEGDIAGATRKLVRVMAGIRSVYPVSTLHICSEQDEQNPILLDRSILGTIKYDEP